MIFKHVLPHIYMYKYSEVFFSTHYSVQPKLYLILILAIFALKFSLKIVFFPIFLYKMAAKLNFEIFKTKNVQTYNFQQNFG